MNEKIVQMCSGIINLLNEGKTVDYINNSTTDERISCDDIDCMDCPLHKAKEQLKLYSCMQLNETQLLNTCREYLNADIKDIYFTSGGSEADNQAIISAAEIGKKKGKMQN